MRPGYLCFAAEREIVSQTLFARGSKFPSTFKELSYSRLDIRNLAVPATS